MLKKWPWLVAGSVVAGVAIGWSTARDPDKPAVASTPAPSSPREASKPLWSAEDFLKSASDRRNNYAAIHDDLLIDWTNDEIRAALDASLTNPDCVLRGGTLTQVPRILLGEWMKRDLTAAVTWFESLDSSTAQQRLASHLSDQWPPDKGAEGLAFLKAHRDLFRGGTGARIVQINLNQ
ncbi:MAG: hypothetical protein EOP83_29155, partial [Verrucomicrobiaceae bacterium]